MLQREIKSARYASVVSEGTSAKEMGLPTYRQPHKVWAHQDLGSRFVGFLPTRLTPPSLTNIHILWMLRGLFGHAVRSLQVLPGPPEQKGDPNGSPFCWAHQDLNLGQAEYESAALTKLSYGPGPADIDVQCLGMRQKRRASVPNTIQNDLSVSTSASMERPSDDKRGTESRSDETRRFAHGLAAALPVMIGYVPAGTAFGLLAKSNLLTLADTLGFSAIVFAGASQFMAIGLMQAGTPLLQIVMATFLLNFRHFLMSASLADRTRGGVRWRNALIAYWITDETFAVASAERRTLSPSYLAGLGMVAWLSWITGSTAGYLAGSFIPQRLQESMAVALYALFAALLVPLLKRRIAFIYLAVAAGLLHTALSWAGLSGGWAFVVAIVAPAAAGAVLIPSQTEEEHSA